MRYRFGLIHNQRKAHTKTLHGYILLALAGIMFGLIFSLPFIIK